MRNTGSNHAKGEWLAFIDDDVLPQPGFLAAYNEAFAAAPRDVLNPHHPTPTGDSWAGGLQKENPFSSVEPPPSHADW